MIKGKHYTITKENLLNHEMIGLKIRVIESSDEKRKGVNGKIIDETKNTFVLEKGIVPKKECVFEFDLNGEKVIINGKEILKKAENRL